MPSQADVVWYGDSIIQYWYGKGPEVWKEFMENNGFRSVASGLAGKLMIILLMLLTRHQQQPYFVDTASAT